MSWRRLFQEPSGTEALTYVVHSVCGPLLMSVVHGLCDLLLTSVVHMLVWTIVNVWSTVSVVHC